MTANEIRAKFLRFFESKNHEIVPSGPMVLKNDPSLMFTNAGMNQFKEFFLGHSVPDYKRAADSQKCLRVSGKHNDLEEVGKDTYHHTMFEMLGNWSFGDYFKEKGIKLAWELLTEEFNISKTDLYATVFEGDAKDGLAKDREAFNIWREILPEEKILDGDKTDNFWEMGDQGPCGPCSEIHVDIRPAAEKKKISGRELVNKDHPQVVEIWNLVFMQFNRKANGDLEELPQKHVDTGMGFERLCMILQGKESNYDTDVFTPLIREIEAITAHSYGNAEKTDIAIRVIADHIRAVAFAIADGQLPGNNGAGYVIRRILRRAIRYGFTFLGTTTPFFYRLIDPLEKEMGHAFPELRKQKELCKNVIKEEEQAFLKTLDQGLDLLDQIIEKSDDKVISGQKAFELYDTFGFPIDLTALILEERGYSLDKTGFESELQKQKKRSRSAAASKARDWHIVREDKASDFIGYDYLEADVKITKYREISDKKGTYYQVVFDKTPFYPEGGGQVGDQGYIMDKSGAKISVKDTKKENNLIIHVLGKLPANPEETLKALVNGDKRQDAKANHSATHLLHQALRSILGKHVEQKGSLVSPARLRFDFSHFSKMTDEEIREVEDFVNTRIQKHLALKEQRAISYDRALEEGAIALFGEKYGDRVRTVRFGDSVELCGGTHVQNTGDIWYFKIMNESGVASGVRRIEAITGNRARAYLEAQDQLVQDIGDLVKNKHDLHKGIADLKTKNENLQKQIEHLQQEKARQLKKEIKTELKGKDGIRFLAKQVDMNPGEMKDLVYQLGGELDNLFVLLAAEQNGKALLTCYISKNLVETENLNAGTIIHDLAKHIQGGGGGQAFLATAGGKNPAGIPQVLEEVEKFIE